MDVSTTARGTVNGCSATPPDASDPNHPAHTDPAPTLRTSADRLASQPRLAVNAPAPYPANDMFLSCLPMTKRHFKTLVACCPPETFKAIHLFPLLQQQFQAIVVIMRDKLFADARPLKARHTAIIKLQAHIDILSNTLEAALATGKFSHDDAVRIRAACNQFMSTIYTAKQCLHLIQAD